jgi:hypothetical protein
VASAWLRRWRADRGALGKKKPMRIPLLRFGRDDRPEAWWEYLFAPIMWPLFFVGLLLLAGLSVVAIPFLLLAQARRERKFAQSMRDRGRFIPWKDLEPRLQDGEGTLLVEQAQKDAIRVWWTQQNVLQEAPTQAPALQDVDYLRMEKPHPFVTWCFDHYLSPETGEASLTDPPYAYPPGFAEESFFKQRFPNLRVVMTVKIA